VATAALLGIDSYVHARDTAFYDAVRTLALSQGTLFRLEAAVAALVAVALLYTYVDVGRLGPLPNMYEPTWALPGKTASARAEGAGIVLAAAGMLRTRRVRPPGPVPVDGRRRS
jgi:hypothetical protein